MRYFTFNKIYLALLLLAAISVFALPKPIPTRMTQQLQWLFAPVSRAVRVVVSPIYGRLHPERRDVESPADAPRTYAEIAQENRELRLALANLTQQLEYLQEINSLREQLGPLRQISRPMRVIGVDSSPVRRSLAVQGLTEGIKTGMAVLYAGGMVGRIDRVGWGNAAQVQLISDTGYRIGGHFGRQVNEDGQLRFKDLGTFHCVVEGNGKRGMIIHNVKMAEVNAAGVAVGDWAVVADGDYPQVLQGYRIAQVTAIRPSRSTLLFAEMDLEPQTNLQMLTEVMVLTR